MASRSWESKSAQEKADMRRLQVKGSLDDEVYAKSHQARLLMDAQGVKMLFVAPSRALQEPTSTSLREVLLKQARGERGFESKRGSRILEILEATTRDFCAEPSGNEAFFLAALQDRVKARGAREPDVVELATARRLHGSGAVNRNPNEAPRRTAGGHQAQILASASATAR